MASFRTKVLKGIGWSTSAQLTTSLLNIIINVVLARLLTPEDFGTIAMVTVISNYGNMIQNFGIGAALIHNPSVDESYRSTAFWMNISLSFIVVSTLLIF